MKKRTLITLFLLWSLAAGSQEINHVDTLQCPIIGFNVSFVSPSASLSHTTDPSGTKSQQGTQADLYKGPYLNFGINTAYKFANNWMLTFDANMLIGNNNLTYRTDRMSSVFCRDSIVIGTNGTDANVTCYNRSIILKGGVGKIFAISDKNPNSGPFVNLSGGWLQNQTVFKINDVNAPQVDGDYAHLYDHQRRGLVLSESVGYLFTSNHRNLANFFVAFEVSQSWTHSTRDYVIDDYLGLRGPDNNKYFDVTFGIKLSWLFPLSGKVAYDYYY